MIDRGEFRDAGDWLQRVYQTELLRPDGLWVDGHPDWEGVGAWLFDVYLNARLAGSSIEQARALVLAQIRASDEWRQKHRPPPASGGIGPESGHLRRAGLAIVREDGRRWFAVGVTAFTLVQAFADGGEAAVAPFVDWMIASGISVARAFGMYNGSTGRFVPAEYGPRYFEAIAAADRYLLSRGCRLKLSVFADAQTDPLNQIDQAALFAHVAAVRDPRGLQDGGNEHGAFREVGKGSKNGWDPQALPRPTNLLASRGSALGDETPPLNPWDFADFHPARNADWPKTCKAIYDIQSGNTTEGVRIDAPLVMDEGIAIGETPENGRTTASPEDCFDYAAGCKLFGSPLIVLHHRYGLQPPGAIGQACIDASVQGFRLVSDDASDGRYTRGGLSECPLEHDDAHALRTYAKLQGDRATAVVLRPVNWTPIAANGWRIVETRGPRQNIVRLER
jgi:hypothetical protein